MSRKKILIIATVLVVIAVAVVAALVLSQKRTDQIIDCAPGYHNVSGPSSECVAD